MDGFDPTNPNGADYLDLFNGDDSVAKNKAAALAQAIRLRRGLGMLGIGTGDPAQAAVGKELSGEADTLDKSLVGAAQHRGEQQIRRSVLAQTIDYQNKMLGQGQQKIDQDKYQFAKDPFSGMPVASMETKTGKVTPVNGGAQSTSPIDDMAEGIKRGDIPPDFKGMYRMAAPVKAKLAKDGFDLSSATREWEATKRHVATLNGPQQERMRQTAESTLHMLDNVEQAYEDFKQTGLQVAPTRFRYINRKVLEGAKQIGGDVGAAAQTLDTAIADLTADIGNVYMGGNAPTDHALTLAGKSLSADWDEPTFKKALALARRNTNIRIKAMESGTAGGSRYDPRAAAVTGGTQNAPDAAALRKKYGL